MKKNEEYTVVIDGNEKKIEVLNCFELGNGKTYVIYKINDEEGIFTSSVIDVDEEIVLSDITDEEMELITGLIKEANEKEV